MNLRSHVEGLAANDSLYHAAVLTRGRECQGRTPSRQLRDSARWVARVRPRWHRCYKNAAEFALAHPDAVYVEGYWRFASGNDPVHHAWNVYRGHVLDLTAEDVERRGRRVNVPLLPADQQDYYGVVIPTELVRQQVEATRRWGPVSFLYLTGADGGGIVRPVAPTLPQNEAP
jgi:hypothetical protein